LRAVSVLVFRGPAAGEGSVPVLVCLPLPLLLWAAVRFGPVGASTGLLAVAFLAISGVVQGRGPFATGAPAENVLPLQLFLAVMLQRAAPACSLLANLRAAPKRRDG
jgi:integral membrane sensor domain MASE1